MQVVVHWNPQPLNSAIGKWKKSGLTDASKHLRGKIRERIAIQGRPRSRRSLPGESPRYETKDLYRSWTYQVSAPQGYSMVYSGLPYSYVLEVGGPGTWGFIQPRPYVRRTLLTEEPELLRLLTQLLP